ncbi:ATP-binding protein [Methanofollis formosanus]|uniref:ATP-binding protein n=1 Tax=Methanofollis formosanus TaxID=299308 RepID=A0A8G1A3S2_9EURY|nr:ATP-binding protein [Methanofollis formosanus]QYZ79916.1 ATP-binding protein [Methanofollis formosanus]
MTDLHPIDNDDSAKYRLIGESVLSYQFIVPHDARIYLGDLLKIADETKGLTFYAKVSEICHACNFADPRWDTRAYAGRFYVMGEDVFLGVKAAPLGYLDEGGKFRKPNTLPSKFSRVVADPDAADFAFLRKEMGEIEVGLLKNGLGVVEGVPVALHAKVMAQHMGVFATTGMGKSNFMKVFSASCMKAREFGMLIVDPHGEYATGGRSSTGDPTKGLLHYTAGRDGLAVFTIDRKKLEKYHLNHLWLEYDDIRASDLNILFDHSGPQHDVLELLGDVRGSDLIAFFEETDFANFDAGTYEGRFKWIAEQLRTSHPGPLNVLKRHFEILTRSNAPFFRKEGSSIPEIVRALDENKVVLIDIPTMGERSELFVLSVITRQIMGRHREWGVDKEERPPQVLIAIEEAQRVLGTGGRQTQIFREAAMEGRKFGVGLCVVTQQPKNIDPRVLAQLNTFVVMGLGDRGDRDIIASSAKQDLSQMDTEIQTLDTGEAVISTLKIPFPVSTKIHAFDGYIGTLNREARRPIDDGLKRGFF